MEITSSFIVGGTKELSPWSTAETLGQDNALAVADIEPVRFYAVGATS